MKGNVDWVDFIDEHGSEGAIFQADSYCTECGNQIRDELDKEGKKPEDPWDEHSFDSDEYPKRADWSMEESDSPQHCASHEKCLNAIELPCGSKIGGWLGGSLTGEGVRNVEKMIRDDIFRNDDHARQVGRLWCHLYRDEIDKSNILEVSSEEAHRSIKNESNRALRQALVRRSSMNKVDVHTILTDLDNVYAVATRHPVTDVRVYRSKINNLGKFEPLESVKVPASVFENETVTDVVANIADDEGWR